MKTDFQIAMEKSSENLDKQPIILASTKGYLVGSGPTASHSSYS